jgi:hypothetical protein
VVAELWLTAGTPSRSHDDPTGTDDTYNLEFPPGVAKWRYVQMGPDRTSPLHTTMTLDYNTILSGEVDLILEATEVHLTAGDTVVLPGTAHAWRTGSTGCVMSITMIGLSERDRSGG